MPKKPILKQVGFFMSSFDIFCQHFCSKNTQNQKSHTFYKAFSLHSKFTNMKELRVQHRGKPLRAFFTFDPLRQAIVLCIADRQYLTSLYKNAFYRLYHRYTAQ